MHFTSRDPYIILISLVVFLFFFVFLNGHLKFKTREARKQQTNKQQETEQNTKHKVILYCYPVIGVNRANHKRTHCCLVILRTKWQCSHILLSSDRLCRILNLLFPLSVIYLFFLTIINIDFFFLFSKLF